MILGFTQWWLVGPCVVGPSKLNILYGHPTQTISIKVGLISKFLWLF